MKMSRQLSIGFITNIINITTFLKAKVIDNVSILLLSLSMSDLTFLFLVTPNACFWITWIFTSSCQTLRSPLSVYETTSNYPWPFHYKFIHTLFYWPAFTAFDISAFISVSVGLMRCACVAMPLKFKVVFTKSRTIKWILFLIILAVSLRIPVLSIHRVTWETEPSTNTSYVYLSAVKRAAMSQINDIINRGFGIWFNCIVVITCVCVRLMIS